MKLTTNLIDRYGADKVIHFLVGSVVTSLMGLTGVILFGYPGLFIGLFIGLFCAIPFTYIISIYKEKKLDDSPDLGDVRFAMLGVSFILIFSILIYGLAAII